jgi:hypothetical protein
MNSSSVAKLGLFETKLFPNASDTNKRPITDYARWVL